MLKPSITLFLASLISICSYSAHADIYEYIDEAGVTHYSDAPSNDDYVLILKSELPATVDTASANATTDNTLTSALSTTKLSTDSLTLTPPQLLAQIEQSAQNNQLDSELIHAVIHVESAYKQQATSRKGAQGLMQLMPATAKRFGVNNSYDASQNIEGGAKYLKQLLTLFNNDLSLAIAAYNAGENAVIRYGNRIPPYKETQAYVPKVLNIYKALLKQREQGKRVM